MSRIDKVNQQVKREIGLILRKDMGDPRLEFVTITHVKVSKDIRTATVFFSVLSSVDQRETAQNALESAKGRIRSLISKRLQMRNTPDLYFKYDSSLDSAMRIEETLQEIHHVDEKDHTDA